MVLYAGATTASACTSTGVKIMCRGSVRAASTEDAEVGVAYQVTETSYDKGAYRHGVLHQPGNGRDEHGTVACAACIRSAMAVQLIGVPGNLQQRFGIAGNIDALFLPGPEDGSDTPDKIELVDGRKLPLWLFADAGITLTLVTIDATKDTTTVPPELADLPSGSLVDMTA